MPSKAEGLVLTVDPNLIHKVDTNNAENLFSMWTVFSRCADSVEQGRRLENLSWRLWNRETFCCETKAKVASSPLSDTSNSPFAKPAIDMPALSSSLESSNTEDAIEDLVSDSEPVDICRPHVLRQDSCSSSRSRGREPHITSDRLEQMVVHIVNEKEPKFAPLHNEYSLSAPKVVVQRTPSHPAVVESQPSPVQAISDIMPASHGTSHASESIGTPAKKVIYGFSPSSLPIRSAEATQPKASQPDAIPEPLAQPAPKQVQAKGKKQFLLSSTTSSSDSTAESLEEKEFNIIPPKTNLLPQRDSTSSGESPSLKSALHRPGQLGGQKKQASFANILATHRASQAAISDNSDDYDESAIDDDDSDSDWEDSIEESGKSSLDDQVSFKRVPSKSNLTSQRSLISLMFAGQDQRTKALVSHASQSTSAIPQRARTMQNMTAMANSPNDSDEGLQMKSKGMRPTQLKPINEIPRSSAQPIVAHAQASRHQAALSPRTTRRNMLATELTESLRRQLLWERQQKTSTANAVLKRRHTSHDVANLKQYPEKVHINKQADEPNPSSWNQYFNRETQGGYHAQGW